MINIFLVVIANQFSETKDREIKNMISERLKHSHSTSSLNSLSVTNPGSCWEEFLKLIVRFVRQSFKTISKFFPKKKKKKSNSVSNRFQIKIIIVYFIHILL